MFFDGVHLTDTEITIRNKFWEQKVSLLMAVAIYTDRFHLKMQSKFGL